MLLDSSRITSVLILIAINLLFSYAVSGETPLDQSQKCVDPTIAIDDFNTVNVSSTATANEESKSDPVTNNATEEESNDDEEARIEERKRQEEFEHARRRGENLHIVRREREEKAKKNREESDKDSSNGKKTSPEKIKDSKTKTNRENINNDSNRNSDSRNREETSTEKIKHSKTKTNKENVNNNNNRNSDSRNMGKTSTEKIKQSTIKTNKEKINNNNRNDSSRNRQKTNREKIKHSKKKTSKKMINNKNKRHNSSCPYSILGVPKDATMAEVKAAYRSLALKYHPDKNPGCEVSKDMFTKLVNAYEILGDEESRLLHDKKGEFGAYQTRPRTFNSKDGFYSLNSFITTLNATNFNDLVLFCKSNDGTVDKQDSSCVPWMVKFYASWCVHCKQMMSEWKRAASTMDGIETPLGFVKFGAVNCETEKPLCRLMGVKAYPEIHLFAAQHSNKQQQEQVDIFPRKRPRIADNFIEFCQQGIRLVHEATLIKIDNFIMQKNVTNAESKGLWIVIFEGRNCQDCPRVRSALRIMSANIGKLANFGIFDCSADPKTCRDQYLGAEYHNHYPVVKIYPYKGSKGTGEILLSGKEDPNAVLRSVEKVIRMCIDDAQDSSGVMKARHEEDNEDNEEEPPPQYHPYPQPERRVNHRQRLPPGVKASSRARYISN